MSYYINSVTAQMSSTVVRQNNQQEACDRLKVGRGREQIVKSVRENWKSATCHQVNVSEKRDIAKPLQRQAFRNDSILLSSRKLLMKMDRF